MRKSHQIVFLPGKIAANPRPSTVAGIKRIADAPGWSSPVMLHPRSTPKAAKNYASEARKRKTESVLSPLEKSSILSEKSSLRGEEEERQLDETEEREERKKKRQTNLGKMAATRRPSTVAGIKLEKRSVQSEKSPVTAASPKSGKIAANPFPYTFAGIKRIADTPGWSTPEAAKTYASEAKKIKAERVSLLEKSSALSEKSPVTATSPNPGKIAAIPCPTPKAAKTYASDAKKRKTEMGQSPLIPAKTFGKKNPNSKTKATEPLSTCVFDYEEAENLVGTFKFFRSKGKDANKENKPAETKQKAEVVKSMVKENKLTKGKKNKADKKTDTKAKKESKTAETKKAAKTYAPEAKKRKTENVLYPLERSSILSEKSYLRGEEEERQLDEAKEREERKKKRQLDETMEYGDGKAETAEKQKQKRSPMKKSLISKKAAVTTPVVPNLKSPISASSAAIKSLDFGENKRFGSRAAARRANDRISRDCRSLSSEDEDGGGGGNVNLRDRSVEREKQQFLLNFVLCYA